MASPPNSIRLPGFTTVLAFVSGLICAPFGSAQEPSALEAELRRIFDARQYEPDSFGPARWLDNGASYTTLEPSESIEEAREIVRYETSSGRREVLVAASLLVPEGETKALEIDDYTWSEDRSRLLIFTNTKRVWRRNTRGDYWVLHLESGELEKLADGVSPSTLMFAKFSPNGTRVAYVRENNLYVETIETGETTALTTDGTTINGTSDWVYEEEFGIRDGFRWSPDGKTIAFWNFDSRGIEKFALINNTDSLYPEMIQPPELDPNRRYPLLVFVYGEPAGQTVLDRWGGNNMLFHRALAKEGFVVASFDNRGTPAPKGTAWRKIIYGTVGDLSSRDQAAAVRALLEKHTCIDGTKVAVWGWSGGGSNTLNAMFRFPDLFKVGVSVAPVPDQTLYDTIYQERYMGLPQDNPEGYRVGSPIHFAEGLQGELLIVHGTGDDNVHYQGTERLVNRLIELGKRFDLMVYPNRTHSISEGEGTLLHIYSLIARYLLEARW